VNADPRTGELAIGDVDPAGGSRSRLTARTSADAWRFRVFLALVIAPLFAQLGLVVGRLGSDAREAHGDRLVARADSAIAVLRSERARGADTTTAAAGSTRSATSVSASPAGRLGAGTGGSPSQPDSGTLAVVLNDLRRDSLQAQWLPLGAAGPASLPVDIAGRLESLDRSFWMERHGRIRAASPLEDVDGWDYVGVLLLGSADDPARLPFAPSFAALAVLAFSSLAGWNGFRRVAGDSPRPRASAEPSMPSDPAGGRLPRVRHALKLSVLYGSVFIPPLAFAFWVGTMPTPGAPGHAGQHGLWAITGFAGWAIFAAIGLSLVPIADRPLLAGQAARAWAFLAPSFIHLLIFSIGPILFALWLSFHEWNLLDPARPFVGLDNYRELAGDADFWRAIRNTAVYVLFVPVGMAVALALALFVNRRIPGVRVMRTIFFLPYITSFVAISLVWRWMFQPDVGLFNNLLGRVGIPPQPWLSSPTSALPSLMLMSVWMYAGYMMVIFLAGLQNIPESLYESAKIDGAGPWRRFLHITLPMLRPTLLFILVTMVIFMFQVFTAVYVMTEGGPLHATDVVVYHVYRAAWEYLRMGYASAMAWVLFAIVFVITLIQFRFLGDRTGVAS